MAKIFYYEGKTRVLCSDCRKIIRSYQFERVENTPQDIYLDEDDYYRYTSGYCEDCRILRRKKKIKKIIKITSIVAIVVAACLLVSLFNEGIIEPLHKWTYGRVLATCEENPKILTAVETTNGVGTTTFDTLKTDLADGDYVMNIYGESDAVVQQYTRGEETTLYWEFGEGFGDLSDTDFVLKDGLLYALGEKNKVYYSTAADYAPLLEKLNAYLPQNYCGKGTYTSESWLNDAEQLLTANIVYGDGATCLYYNKLAEDSDEYQTYYYEESDAVFLRVKLEEYGATTSTVKVPDADDCMQITK